MPERFNRTLLDILGTLEEEQKVDWKKYVHHLVYAYNCTPHESTRVSPFELMFKRKPKLPIDAVFHQANENTYSKTTDEYNDDIKVRMEKTRKIVDEHVSKAKDRQKTYNDKKAKAAKIHIGAGDRVLVRILAFRGKHKI